MKSKVSISILSPFFSHFSSFFSFSSFFLIFFIFFIFFSFSLIFFHFFHFCYHFFKTFFLLHFITFFSLTFLLNLSKASFKLNILRRSLILAARRWAILATLQRLVRFSLFAIFLVIPHSMKGSYLLRVFFGALDDDVPLLFGAKDAPRGDNRCPTKPPICDLGQSATKDANK